MGHCSKDEAWSLGKSLVHIEDPLLEIVLIGELHFAFVVAAKFAIREEGGPAFDVPALHVQHAGGDFSFSRSKVEVGNLIAIFIQEH